MTREGNILFTPAIGKLIYKLFFYHKLEKIMNILLLNIQLVKIIEVTYF